MAKAALSRTSKFKPITCPYCGGADEVSPKAMSTYCKHCRKTLILEDYKIKSYYAVREFFTCGEVVVEKKGQVVAQGSRTQIASSEVMKEYLAI